MGSCIAETVWQLESDGYRSAGSAAVESRSSMNLDRKDVRLSHEHSTDDASVQFTTSNSEDSSVPTTLSCANSWWQIIQTKMDQLGIDITKEVRRPLVDLSIAK
jgi:hypothetical protein